MHSPRLSPAIRPQSPLSPRFDAASRYDSMQPSSPRACGLHPRSAATASSRRHRPGSSLNMKLPSLPRFHPANYPSQHSSAANTPASGPNSPQAPTSPMQQQRLYSQAQKQLYMFQRETLAAHAGLIPTREKPLSPRLEPLGSPGPVTPLELEGHDGYLLAGAKAAGQQNDLVEKLIQQEALRSAESAKAPQDPPILGN
ncbi:hypothetical protein AAFC00_004786 [Neodothiora populina]|uniref:Uncharacterized protein n=1 Tax=Neodothiora populina TaxID=2781224 RepID=A0ABR3P3B6_9PEZI